MASRCFAALLLLAVAGGSPGAARSSEIEAERVLADEPGGAPTRSVLVQRGSSTTGGADGTFALDADLGATTSRLIVSSGGVINADGWDGHAWVAHDGAVTQIDLPGAVADARAEDYLRRYGWRDPAERRHARVIGNRSAGGRTQGGIAIFRPGMSSVSLWFDLVTHRLVEAVIDADMGPLSIVFSDWRRVGGSDYAFRRGRRDATGQTTVLQTSRASLTPSRRLARAAETALRRAAGEAMLPFVLDHGERGHIVIDAVLEGRPVKLVFDTGAANYLTPDAARWLGLRVQGGLSVGGVGEESFAGGFARVRSLAFGGAKLTGTSAIVAPLPDAAVRPRPGLQLAGLTGFELLHAFRTTVDYAARTIRFDDPRTPPSHPTRFVSYLSDGQAIFVEATLGGTRGWFRVDTGDAGTVTIFADFAARAALGSGRPTRSLGQAGGELRMSDVTLGSFELAGTTLGPLLGEVSAQRAGAFSSRSIAGNLGVGVLSCFRFSIDPIRRRIGFETLAVETRPASCRADPTPVR